MNPKLVISCLLYCFSNLCHAITIDDFFAKQVIDDISLSPSGRFIASVNSHDNDIIITVLDNQSNKSKQVFSYKQLFSDEAAKSVRITWIDDRHLAASLIQEVMPIAQLVDTKYKSKLIFIDTVNPSTDKNQLIAMRSPGYFINPLPDKAGRFLFAKRSSNSKVFEIDINKLQPMGLNLKKTQRLDGGQLSGKNKIASIKAYAFKWFSHKNKIVGALAWSRDKKLQLHQTKDGGKSWEILTTLADLKQKHQDDNKESITPVRYAGEEASYYAIIKQKGSPSALFKYNFAEDKREIIYQHSDSDIYRVSTSYLHSDLLSVSVKARGELQTVYFRNELKGLEKSLKQQGISGYLAITDSDLSENKFLLYNFSSSNPGSYYYYKNGKAKKITELLPGLSKQLHSELIVRQLVQDKLKIEYFLSKPKHTPTPIPLVVIPHGGPLGVMDNRLYDPLSQYLVSQGMAVLQINYRGSAGYGKAFIDAGKQQWGSGMLADINAVSTEVAKLDFIDGERMCIAGASYGGYAALATPLKYPKQFICAAAIAAVTDVQLYAANIDGSLAELNWLREYVGSAASDAQHLKQISPVYAAHKYQIPLLLVQGEDDKIVDIEHYNRMRFALNQAQIPFQEQLIKGMGHHYENEQQELMLAKILSQFLKQQLQRTPLLSR